MIKASFIISAAVPAESSMVAEESFDPAYNHSSRPYVGTPFIQLKLPTPILTRNGVNYMKEQAEIRLVHLQQVDHDPN